MKIITYSFDYGSADADCTFEVDIDVFTDEKAQEYLDFFSWEEPYDEDENPVDEYMKKMAIICIKQATAENYNAKGVIESLMGEEGYPYLDGSDGIKLVGITSYPFSQDNLEMTRTEQPPKENPSEGG